MEYTVFYVKNGMDMLKSFNRLDKAKEFYSFAKYQGCDYGYRFVEKDF